MTSVATGGAPWSPPLDAEALSDLLNRLQEWSPLNSVAVLADVAAAMDGMPLAADELEPAIQRLLTWLKQLTGVAVSTGASRSSRYISDLVRQARSMQQGKSLGTDATARGYVQQLGWYTGELLEQLVALGCVRGDGDR